MNQLDLQNLRTLSGIEPPFVHFSSSINGRLLESILRNHAGLAKFVLMRGEKMANWGGFFQEFSEKFAFPDYFSWNLNSFNEIMRDLSWISERAFLVLVTNAGTVLSEEEHGAGVVSEYMESFGEHWSKPIRQGEWWDRESVPFHTVLHFEKEIPVG